MTGAMEKGNIQRYRHTGRTPCEDEAEIGVRQLQVKDHQGLPATRRGTGRSLPGEHGSDNTLILDF